MKETGRVKKILGRNAEVEIDRKSACGACGACHMSKDQSVVSTWAKNPLRAQKGDTVEVELAFAGVMLATGILYGIPLLAFVVGCSLTYYLGGTFQLPWDREMVSFCVGLVVIFLTYLIIRVCDRWGWFNTRTQSVITMVVPENNLIS